MGSSNGMMSKQEFVRLVEKALKKTVKETVVDIVWSVECNTKKV